MARLACKSALCLIAAFILTGSVQAQTTTYRLHKEASSSAGLFQLKTTAPDATSQAVQSADLKNTTGEKVIKEFDTQVGDPGASGVIPTGSTVSFTLWMKKSANVGVMTPRAKVKLNNSTGTTFCTATGAALGWQSVAQYQFNCTTTANITITSTTRLYVWVGVNITTKPTTSVIAELDIEGTQSGNYDSLVVVPQPPPTISSLSPNSGAAGAAVTVTGTNFGMAQGASTLKFNGVTATPTSWNPTAINAAVPSGATTGPVVVTVGVASNGSTFTVVTTGTLSGSITRASDSTALSGALVELLQSGVVKASANTAANGSYSIPNLSPGVYDARVSLSGYITELRNANSVTVGNTTTVNVALYRPGTISGKITKTDGTTAIAGASVKARLGTVISGPSNTNATGDYSITGLRPGTYTVEASATGYATRSKNSVTVNDAATTTANLSLDSPVAGPVSYVYDELGRLTAVVGSTETVIYNYDAVGNLLSISRRSSAQVSIISFTPGNGAVGAQVTIYGTGFSSTANQNTLTFNGVSATVTSSTNTKIVASVPTGATTGPIVVTSPSGSATSSTSFIVGDNRAPTIAGFTPTVGHSGNVVTITGTNFEPIASSNKVKFNNTYAAATSATTTSISTSVPPQAGSGRMTVMTPLGKATSSGYFFIPPAPYTAANVDYTGQMLIGESKVISVNTNNKLALVVFEGTAQQEVSLKLDNLPSFSEVLILDPDGEALTSTLAGVGSTFLYDTVALPVTGTYTIMVKANGTNPITLSLYNIVHFTSTITPGGAAVTATTNTPGQNAKLTFSGTAQQRVSLKLSNGTFERQLYVTVLNPDGTTLVAPALLYSGSAFIDAWTLPVTGTYTILIDPAIYETGSVNVNLYDVVDTTGPITPGATAIPVTINTPGQVARLTFSGTSGQQATVQITNNTLDHIRVKLVASNGTVLTEVNSIWNPPSFNLSTQTLANDTYTIVISSTIGGTGSCSVSVAIQ